MMNPTIIVMSRIFATVVLTMFIWSLSSCPNPHIMPATASDMPPTVSSITLLRRLMR